MPRPAVLDTLDWSAILSTAVDYPRWLASAEFAENVASLEANRKALRPTEDDLRRLAALSAPVHVLAFAEDWCGDVLRHVPTLEKLADLAPSVRTYYLTRAQAPEVFVRFLTNGGEAVPKFVFISQRYVECGNWGPMPEASKELIARGKACGDVATARKLVAAQYKADAAQREVIEELLHLLEIAATTEVADPSSA